MPSKVPVALSNRKTQIIPSPALWPPELPVHVGVLYSPPSTPIMSIFQKKYRINDMSKHEERQDEASLIPHRVVPLSLSTILVSSHHQVFKPEHINRVGFRAFQSAQHFNFHGRSRTGSKQQPNALYFSLLPSPRG